MNLKCWAQGFSAFRWKRQVQPEAEESEMFRHELYFNDSISIAIAGDFVSIVAVVLPATSK